MDSLSSNTELGRAVDSACKELDALRQLVYFYPCQIPQGSNSVLPEEALATGFGNPGLAVVPGGGLGR